MWKKWLNIILSLWLINAVTYVHGSNPFDHSDEGYATTSPSCQVTNTWVDSFLQIAADDGGLPSRKAHKIKFQRRYVHTRSNSVSVFLPVAIFLWLYALLKKDTSAGESHYSIGVALRPAYYNFLFRLSPF